MSLSLSRPSCGRFVRRRNGRFFLRILIMYICRKTTRGRNVRGSAHRFAVLSSAARTFGATPAAAEDKFCRQFTCASLSRGRNDFGQRAVEATERLNRRPFDCFKSAEGIRFSTVARPTPKSFHRGGFWRYLLAAQKVTYIFKHSGCGPLRKANAPAEEHRQGRASSSCDDQSVMGL